MPSTKLARTTYQNLLNGLGAIYDKAMRDVGAAVDSILKDAYREMGRLIVEVEQKGELHAEYGSHLLEKISEDLSKTGRKGFSVSNLKNMRQVYIAFPIRQTSGELTWSHYVALSSIKDNKQRQSYTKKAIQRKLSVDDLQAKIREENVELISASLPKAIPAPRDAKIIRLADKRGVPGLYPVVERLIAKRPVLRLDTGFKSHHKIPEAFMNKVKVGDIFKVDVSQKAPALELVKDKDKPLYKSALYTFAGSIDTVIDGDTVKVAIDQGFDNMATKKLRLRKVNAPEIDTKKGQAARAFVERALNSVERFIIKTYSTDIYDRYLVDIFYLLGSNDPYQIAAHGILLNQELINHGLADLWRTPDPAELAFLN